MRWSGVTATTNRIEGLLKMKDLKVNWCKREWVWTCFAAHLASEIVPVQLPAGQTETMAYDAVGTAVYSRVRLLTTGWTLSFGSPK